VSLAGEIRPVAHSAIRLREAAKLGFGSAFGPGEASGKAEGSRFTALSLLPNLVDRIMVGA
jgi:DNA repair protein RadA/Sms